jgi:hypothetical protein
VANPPCVLPPSQMRLSTPLHADGASLSLPPSDLDQRVWHQGAISRLAAENAAFEPSLRLAKRWVASQLLSPHLDSHAVELLVAVAFTAHTAIALPPSPGSRTSGFLRFLYLLARQPWRVQPLVVDPGRELSVAQRAALMRGGASAGAASMRLCTAKDPSGAAWTGSRPSPPLLHRIAVLAGRAAEALEGHLLSARTAAAAAAQQSQQQAGEQRAAGDAAIPLPAAHVFSCDLTEYDMLIRLRRDALPNAHQGLLAPRGAEGGAWAEGMQLAAEADKNSRAILKGIPTSECRGVGAV